MFRSGALRCLRLFYDYPQRHFWSRHFTRLMTWKVLLSSRHYNSDVHTTLIQVHIHETYPAPTNNNSHVLKRICKQGRG